MEEDHEPSNVDFVPPPDTEEVPLVSVEEVPSPPSDDMTDSDPSYGGQIVRFALLRGFDPASNTATFAYEREGRMIELNAVIDDRNPMGREIHRILLQTQGNDGRVPALQIRVAFDDPNADTASLIFAQPAAPEADNRFMFQGAELRWTETLDEAIDGDFDWHCQEFSLEYIEEKLKATDPAAAFSSARDRAREVFVDAAKGLGLREPEVLFDRAAPFTFEDVLAGKELSAQGERQVRYDIRYSFKQQSAHLAGASSEALISALANYSCQVGVSLDAAERAMSKVPLSTGKVGSLAEAHQIDLVNKDLLIAPNPSLLPYRNTFAAYSHETVRLAIGRVVGGAMDAAGIPAARPAVDAVELEKRFGDKQTSFHHMAAGQVPENLQGQARAGAYLAHGRNVAKGFRDLTKEQVGRSQSQAIPAKNFVPKDVEMPNELAKFGINMLTQLERGIDML